MKRSITENNFYRAEARLLAGYKPAPRVDDNLQLKTIKINEKINGH